MFKRAILFLFLLSGLAFSAGAATFLAGTTSTVATGGTAVSAVTGPAVGCYIFNGSTATEQNIATAEVLYVDPVTTATTTAGGSNVAMVPGQNWSCPGSVGPGRVISINAATSGHKVTVVVW